MTTRQNYVVQRIVSGGQTGVDRGALDAAIFLGIEHGGWCPRGRLAEDGIIPARYELTETDSAKYPIRTQRNVIDSDGTLILYEGELQGGTALTLRFAKEHNKPCLAIDLASPLDFEMARQWIVGESLEVLNVAGPRESSSPGIADAALSYLTELLRR
ncbi:MAG: putative molybdenum carrier protein [Planctomycetaceae bacterium]|nr:putative molybdenum carrier protein [Planctomycetales bacterium]MCB9938415.1 putative molybdenum carrier protein [Planctomycetaceae bacterium]